MASGAAKNKNFGANSFRARMAFSQSLMVTDGHYASVIFINPSVQIDET